MSARPLTHEQPLTVTRPLGEWSLIAAALWAFERSADRAAWGTRFARVAAAAARLRVELWERERAALRDEDPWRYEDER